MTAPGIAAAFRLMPWCALLYVPFRWRPIGLYLITQKPITQKPAADKPGLRPLRRWPRPPHSHHHSPRELKSEGSPR